MICENRNLEDWESLLLLSLEIGFRHLDPQNSYIIGAELTHTEHHRELVDIVFWSGENEVIADLLHAWTATGSSHAPASTLLGTCARHLVGLHNLVPSSSRLRRLVIRSVEVIGYKGFEGLGVKRFIELLDHLHVAVQDTSAKSKWTKHLLDTLQSSEGTQHLSRWYWELLVELTITEPLWPGDVYRPQIMRYLTEAQEWSKLECWIGTIWILWPPGDSSISEEDLDRSMLLLFDQRPGAAQKLEQWMGRWSQECGEDIPESFQEICERAHKVAQRGAT